MAKGSTFLSDLVLNRTYSAIKDSGFKESYEEVCERVLAMHYEKFPALASTIELICADALTNKMVVPSMRSLQFAGEGIKRNNIRNFNCSYTTLESFTDFAEIFYILMCGTGVGFSARSKHVSNLPVIPDGSIGEVYMVPDDKEGWADSVKLLLANPRLTFDYSLVRPAGAPLSTGGTASGPAALMLLHTQMQTLLQKASGRKLGTLESHDLVCMIADAVVVGGVRRAALISIFDCNDTDLLTCKSGDWWNTAPWRGRANNSASLNRNSPTSLTDFARVMNACFESNAGEPGIFWTNNDDLGANPCLEISLLPRQMCNLSEVNLSACRNFAEVQCAVVAATILGTIQATYTDFPYLTAEWKTNCDAEALLGVSFTGQASAQHHLTESKLQALAELAVATNKEWAHVLGINPSARIGCTKPSGSASAFLGTTSGVHAAHSEYFIRRVRIDKTNPLAIELLKSPMARFIEEDTFTPSNLVVSMPVSMVGAVLRENESALELMERARNISLNWIRGTHQAGENLHNVSMTVSYREEEKEDIINWMWENRQDYTGISLLPFSESSYVQMPFETITREQYEEMLLVFPEFDFESVNYKGEIDGRAAEQACAGGSCELT